MFSFLGKRTSPLTPPKRKGRGAFPLGPAHWQFVARRAARAAQCRCGVHGFAMNPCESSPLATAPYYREARVTFAWRQTACGMRHCCARRIVECSGRRKLGCTSTRSAERQRIIEAEANRLAVLTRQRRAQAVPFRRHKSRSSPKLPIKAFLLGFQRGYSLLRKRISPLTRAAPLALLPRGTRAATHFAPEQNCTENFPKTY